MSAALSPIDEVVSRHDTLCSQHEKLQRRISELENMIVSVPETIERRRSRYRDMLPPADLAFNAKSTDRPTHGRRSRSQIYAARQTRVRRIILLALTLSLATGLVLLVSYLASRISS